MVYTVYLTAPIFFFSRLDTLEPNYNHPCVGWIILTPKECVYTHTDLI